MRSSLSIDAVRFSRFALTGYNRFARTCYEGRTQLLSSINVHQPASVVNARLVLCDRETLTLPQFELQSDVCVLSPINLLEVCPKLQERKAWDKYVLPNILSEILNIDCISHDDFMQLRQVVLVGKKYSNSVLQAAMLIGDFYRAAVQLDRKPKRGKELTLREGYLHGDSGDISLKLYVSKTGALEISATSSVSEDSPPVGKTIMPFLPSSYIESKHLFLLGALEAIESFKFFTPDEERELQELALGEEPFSRTAIQLAIFLNNACATFSKLSEATLLDKSRIIQIGESVVKSSDGRNTAIDLSISHGQLQLTVTPIIEDVSVYQDIAPDDPAYKKPGLRSTVLSCLTDAFENIDVLSGYAEPVKRLLNI